jgi:DNA repair protein RadA/Sms
LRLREAEKLGFGSVATGQLGKADKSKNLLVTEYAQLADMVSAIAAKGQRAIPEPEAEGW